MRKLIKKGIAQTKMFHGTLWFIDDLCVPNDGGQSQKSYKEIYSKEVVLKLEYFGSHSTFLDLYITMR